MKAKNRQQNAFEHSVIPPNFRKYSQNLNQLSVQFIFRAKINRKQTESHFFLIWCERYISFYKLSHFKRYRIICDQKVIKMKL